MVNYRNIWNTSIWTQKTGAFTFKRQLKFLHLYADCKRQLLLLILVILLWLVLLLRWVFLRFMATMRLLDTQQLLRCGCWNFHNNIGWLTYNLSFEAFLGISGVFNSAYKAIGINNWIAAFYNTAIAYLLTILVVGKFIIFNIKAKLIGRVLLQKMIENKVIKLVMQTLAIKCETVERNFYGEKNKIDHQLQENVSPLNDWFAI